MKKLLPLFALVAFFYLPAASASKGVEFDFNAGANALSIAPLFSEAVKSDFEGR